ncbi:autotransporter outer membrane beta-barrel domain-containing protein [Kaistia dalseonensis]|uniref:Outer membrane autotransporter protein n=1 Tax=Kaistia dalseonensis TaxID=410840 RepID=A0ABU0H488_9HYPH|nr:autotransporter outer membrane beta-barrel domain-containing protein [Kaistia dalseonensis]MCX5494537.1 autotransporter outer membrane beta-barrel domain-containing protein [Kaistia dalseonensis]MDQ0437116.1 outer membrane autotransporter protein [Kaistia dalseonensis]
MARLDGSGAAWALTEWRPGSIGLAALALALLSSTAHAQSVWIAPGQADWAIDANWNPAAVPTAASDVVIDNNGEAQITAPGATARAITLGTTTGTGTLTITQSAVGGTLVSASAVIGQSGTGVLNVSRLGSSWTNSGTVVIGDAAGGSGTLTVDMSATITTNTDAGSSTIIGNEAGATGIARVDGAGSSWTSGGTIIVGNAGTGSLTVSSSGVVTDTDAAIGALAGGTGTVKVTGDGSNWSHTGTLVIGGAGTGELTIEAMGTVGDAVATIGELEGGSGTVKATGSGSAWTTTGALTIGEAGDGALTVESGASVTAASATVGALEGGSGTTKVTGSGSSWTTSTELVLGDAGDGTLTIEAGGAVSDASAVIGNRASGTGAATVTGADSSWTTEQALTIGKGGNGALTVELGGTVSDDSATIGASAGGSGSAKVSGSGTLWETDSTLTIGDAGAGSLTVQGGGSVTAGEVTIGAAKSGAGSAIVSGDGSSLTMDGLLTLGADGDGALTIAAGGMVTSADATLGANTGGTGAASISGEGSNLSVDGTLTVGAAGTGTLAIAESGTVSNTESLVGAEAGGTGVVTVSGDGSQWINAGQMTIGARGDGALEIGAGGTTTSASAVIGEGAGGTGTVSVNGQGSSLTVANELTIGAEGDGTLSITNEGAVSVGGGEGTIVLAASAGSSGTIQIGAGAGAGTLQAAEITGGDGEAAVVFNHNEGAYAFATRVTGSTALYQIGNGTTVLTAANLYEGVTAVEAGTLRAGAAAAFSPLSAVSIANGAVLDLAGYSQTVASLSNAGTVSVLGTTAGATLAVSGDYVGSGTLTLGTALGGDASATDRLTVAGNVSGVTRLQVVNLGGSGAATLGDGIELVSVAGASPGNAFNANRLIAGAWDYRLYQGGVGSDANNGNWYLRSDLSYAAQTYRAYPATLLAYGRESIGTLRERTGGWQTGAAITNLPGGAWVRARGSWADMSPDGGSPYDQTIKFGQAGAEAELPVNANGALSAGLMATFGQSATTVSVISHGQASSGSIDTNAYGIGGNLTWRGNDGFYADAVAQATFYDTDVATNEIGTLVSGASATGAAASLEIGRAFPVGQGFTLTPEAQLVYTSVNFDGFSDRDTVSVKGGSADSLVGRVGLRAEHAGFVSADAADAMRLNAYLIANVAYAFIGGTDVIIANTTLSQEQTALAGELGLGATLTLGMRSSLYGELSYATTSLSSGDDNLWAGGFGLRVQW